MLCSNMGMNTLVLVVCSLSCVWGDTVTIKQGTLEGTQLESRGGRKFEAFLGIPFAKPPTGELRFKSPAPHPGWKGTRDASKEGAMCPQEMIFVPRLRGIRMGEEDCLYLNVYTPDIKPGKKYPVMVWIHGGGFQMGDSHGSTYGPYYLLDRDVVYVNFNYRLGVLGFFSLETPSVSGNFGLKDQQLVLQWVKDNIEAFNGDPNSVTIFGESAGGASVHYHLLSPKSNGLFHRAIMQSGSSFCPWALVPQGIAKARGQAFATLLGCHGDEEEIVACLRKVPSDALLANQLKFVQWDIDPMITFAPVVEPIHGEAFITQHPYLATAQPEIPLVIGFNKDEGALRTAKLCADNMLALKQLNDHWERYLPLTMVLNELVDRKDVPRVTADLKKFYLNGRGVTAENIGGLTDMYSDTLINHCVMKAAQHHSGSVHFYLYSHEAKISWNSVFGNCSVPLGVTHADEMINLFNLDSLFEDHDLTGKDLEISQTMLALWTNFAAKGIPTNDAGTIEWPLFNSRAGKDYLEFGQEDISTVRGKPFEDRLKFVESLPLTLKKYYSQRGDKTEL